MKAVVKTPEELEVLNELYIKDKSERRVRLMLFEPTKCPQCGYQKQISYQVNCPDCLRSSGTLIRLV